MEYKKMSILTLKSLEDCFRAAKIQNAKYIGIRLLIFGEPEVIIINRLNFTKKLTYFTNAFNPDLSFKYLPQEIQILGFKSGNNLIDLGKELGL